MGMASAHNERNSKRTVRDDNARALLWIWHGPRHSIISSQIHKDSNGISSSSLIPSGYQAVCQCASPFVPTFVAFTSLPWSRTWVNDLYFYTWKNLVDVGSMSQGNTIKTWSVTEPIVRKERL